MPHCWVTESFTMFFFKLGSQMRCSAEDNHNMVYMHVWKAAGYSVMENLKAIGSNYEAGPPASTIFSSKNGRTTSIHQFFFKLWFFDGEKKGSTSWMRNSDVFFRWWIPLRMTSIGVKTSTWCRGRWARGFGGDTSLGSKSLAHRVNRRSDDDVPFAGEVRLIPLVI